MDDEGGLLSTNKAPRSIGRKLRGLPRKAKDLSKEELLLTLQKKKECNAKALAIVEGLLHTDIAEKRFLDALHHINQSHFQDAVEERVIIKLCGYPLCSNTLKNVPTQQYRISTKHNKVYDITERKNYCSNQCFRAAKFIKDQMLTSPLWLRDVEATPQFKLLPCSVVSGGAGDEVDVGPERVSKEEVIKMKYECAQRKPALDKKDNEQTQVICTSASEELIRAMNNLEIAASLPRRNTVDVPKVESHFKLEKKVQATVKESYGEPVARFSACDEFGSCEKSFASLASKNLNNTIAVSDSTDASSSSYLIPGCTDSPSSETNLAVLPGSSDTPDLSKVEQEHRNIEKIHEYANIVGDTVKERTANASEKKTTCNENFACKSSKINVNHIIGDLTSFRLQDSSNRVTVISGREKKNSETENRKNKSTSHKMDVGDVIVQKNILTDVTKQEKNMETESTRQDCMDQKAAENSSKVDSPQEVKESDIQLNTEDNRQEFKKRKEPYNNVSNLKHSAKVQRSKETNQSSILAVSPLISHVEESIHDWFTIDTMCFLFGETRLKEMLEEKGKSIMKHYQTLDSLTWDPEKHERFLTICKRLSLLEVEDSNYDVKVIKEDHNAPRKPLPDFQALKEDAEKMNLKVKAFYKGKMEIDHRRVAFSEDTKDVIVEESKEDEAQPALPLVHLHAQRALRKRIVLDGLNRVMPDFLRTFGLCSSELSSSVRGLVGTFALSAKNITFKPQEWSLLGLIVIKLLSIREPRVQLSLATEQSGKYLTLLLMSYTLEPTYLDHLLMWLTDVDQFVEKHLTPHENA